MTEEPTLDAPLGLTEAKVVLSVGLDLLEPSAAIEESWEHFEGHLRDFIGGNPCTINCMIGWRTVLEQVKADSPEGDRVLASMKLAIDAFVVATLNPYALLLDDRCDYHNDVDPLVRKAVAVQSAARGEGDGFDRRVTYDESVNERFEEVNERNRLRSLIDNAIRPGDDQTQPPYPGWSAS